MITKSQVHHHSKSPPNFSVKLKLGLIAILASMMCVLIRFVLAHVCCVECVCMVMYIGSWE